ncbi:MAG: tyrosine recombinase [Patescibacteria group bacterium]|nr:MAG: tyrosine recombinase [Patescibacteria group bacterium]
MNVSFKLRKGKKKNTIYVRVCIGGETADASTFIQVEPWQKWARNRVTGEGSKTKNAKLLKIKAHIVDIYEQLTLQHGQVTARQVVDAFTGKSRSRGIRDLLQDFRKELSKRSVKESTKRAYGYCCKVLEREFEATGIEAPEQIDVRFFEHLETRYNHSAAQQIIRFTNRFLEFCSLKRIEYKSRKRARMTSYLTKKQLKELASLNVEKELKDTKRLLLLITKTGLQIKDFKELRSENIEKEDGMLWLVKQRAKTGHTLIVPISPETLKELLYFMKKGIPSPDTLYYRFKKLSELLGFEVNARIARKTAGMLWLNEGYSIESVSKMLGHSNISTTERHYAAVLKQRIKAEYRKLFDF